MVAWGDGACGGDIAAVQNQLLGSSVVPFAPFLGFKVPLSSYQTHTRGQSKHAETLDPEP